METLNDVLEQLIYLCEIRGELDPETNARTEQKIADALPLDLLSACLATSQSRQVTRSASRAWVR